MEFDLKLEADYEKGIWTVRNRTKWTDFTAEFNDRCDAIEFMAKMIAEVHNW